MRSSCPTAAASRALRTNPSTRRSQLRHPQAAAAPAPRQTALAALRPPSSTRFETFASLQLGSPPASTSAARRLRGSAQPPGRSAHVALSTNDASAEPRTDLQERLLEAIRDTNRGKACAAPERAAILRMFTQLEEERPPPANLLSDPAVAKQLLDGRWFLQYTAPDEANPAAQPGSVRASGVEVDTSKPDSVIEQNFDVDNGTVQNVVVKSWGSYFVQGDVECSPESALRADITFRRVGLNALGLKWDTGLLFDFINSRRKEGAATPWLDTTMIDQNMRLARGNKGSIFILTRDQAI